MKNKVKSTFRSSLIVGLIPLLTLAVIASFAFWAISSKNKTVEQNVEVPEVVHDTIFVKVPCQKNHFECPPVETKRKKAASVVIQEVPEVNEDTTVE